MKYFLKTIGLIIIFLIGVIIQPILWLISKFVSDDKDVYYHTLRKFVHGKCQCNNYWHNAFHSESEFNEFEKTLDIKFKPIAHTISYSPKPKVKFLFYEYGAMDWEGGFIYECNDCKILWELSWPENAYRGYFKSINLNLIEINDYLKK